VSWPCHGAALTAAPTGAEAQGDVAQQVLADGDLALSPQLRGTVEMR
jgi:hypothetical protein